MDEKKMLNGMELHDEELDKISGGAAKVVAADDAAATTKTTEGGTIDIVKNGKKFSVPGATMR